MRPLIPFVFALFTCLNVSAQKIEDGLWNVGRAFSLVPVEHDGIFLQKQLTLVQLYSGFSVVKSVYEVRNNHADSFQVTLKWTDTLTTEQRFFRSLNNLPSSGMKLLLGRDTLRPEVSNGVLLYKIMLAPASLSTITTYQLTSNSQAKLSGDETVKEMNGFVFSFDNWQQHGVRQVFIKLMGGLSLNNIKGIYPATVTGTMDKLKWIPDSLNETLVVWYDGQAPDYKFEKKVLPKQHLLFEDINNFDISFFDGTGFKPVDKTDFTTNTRSTVGTVLYFIMFTIPWIFLIWFIIYLLRKPRKK
jgi:hypothetical protein